MRRGSLQRMRKARKKEEDKRTGNVQPLLANVAAQPKRLRLQEPRFQRTSAEGDISRPFARFPWALPRAPWNFSQLPASLVRAQEGPRSSQEGPERPPRRSRRAPRRRMSAPRRPRWPQDGPRGLQDRPRGPQEAFQEGPERPKLLIFHCVLRCFWPSRLFGFPTL